MRVRALVIAALLLVGLSACDPGPGTARRYGEPELRIPDQDGGTESPLVDFGPVFFGHDGRQRMTITNRGLASLTFEGFRGENGVPIGLFSVEPEGAPQSLGPSESLEVTLVFTPDEHDSGSPNGFHDYEGQVTLLFDGTHGDQGEVVIRVRGRGVDPACGLPKVLNFGNVRVGTSKELSVELRNPTVKDTVGFVAPLYASSGDSVDFHFGDGSPVGAFSLPAQTSAGLHVTFNPSRKKDYLAFFHYRIAEECPEQIVTVEGLSFGDTLEWPSTIDCDYQLVNSKKNVEVTFRNFGHEPVTISNLGIDSLEFTLSDVTDFTLQPEGVPETRILTCQPTRTGKQLGSLRFDTSLSTQSTGVVPLSVDGV